MEKLNYEVHTINIGDLFVSEKRLVLQTILGSCVSLTLFDKVLKIGGMNHIVLPGAFLEKDVEEMLEKKDLRYGIFSVEKLIYEMEQLGSKRKDLEARIFGASYIGGVKSVLNIQDSNVEFVRTFLRMARIKIIEEQIFNEDALKILFYTDTGEVEVKKLKNEK